MRLPQPCLIVLCALLGFCQWTGFGGSADYVVRTWMNEDGLPQATINSIIQTRDGYLWLGTFNGLVRFDGLRFTTFNTVNTKELPSDWITYLYEDRAGSLWIGTRSGLACWRDGKWMRTKLPASLQSADICRIIETDDGAFVISTVQGLFRSQAGSFEEIPVPEPQWPTRQSWLTQAPDGTVWVAHRFALYTLAGRELKLRSRFPSGINSLSMTRDGTQWIAFEDGDLLQWFPDGRTNTLHFPNTAISCVYQARNGEIWMGSLFGVYRWVDGELRTPSTVPGRIGERVGTIMEDREGIIWIGTNGNGLHRLGPNPVATISANEGLGYDDVATFWQDNTGDLWAGAFDGGLNHLKDGKWNRVVQPGILERDTSVSALIRDRKGRLWIGCYGARSSRMIQSTIELAPHLPDIPVRVFFEDRNGCVWAGTENGAYCFNGEAVQYYGVQEGLSAQAVRGIVQDSSGAIWIATERGLNRFDNKGAIKQYFAENGLGANFIQTLFVDAADTLWIGTAGGGLTRRKNENFATITSRQGLFADVISQIIEDGAGYLWIGSNSGIFRVKKQAVEDVLDGKSPAVVCTAFGKENGMRHLECAGGFQPSCMKTSDEHLWFSTVGGIVVIDPKHLQVNNSAPEVHIETVTVDGEIVLPRPGSLAVSASGLSKEARSSPSEPASPAGVNEVVIPPGRHRVEVQYTGINFRAPGQIQFKYRLSGYDDRWDEAGTRRTAYFNRVPPGHYRFEVMAVNNQGIWNETPTALAFLYQPHFWETAWFQCLVVMAAAALVWWIYRARKQAAQRVQDLRLRIAQDLHDEVGSNLGSIALLSQLVSRSDSGAASSELDEIAHLARQTVSAVRDVAWFINPEFDTVSEMCRHLESTAARLFPGGRVNFQAAGLEGDRRFSVTFRRNVFFIFKEAVHNAAKYSQAELLEVSLAIEGEDLVLIVKDHGVGFDPLRADSGNGLVNLKRRAGEIHGTLTVRSQPGQGTSVTLRAPMA